MEDEYKIKFYKNRGTDEEPVRDFINNLNKKTRAKIRQYLELLRFSEGYLSEPYARHIIGKIRELRVRFARDRYRIFYFTLSGKNIILLHVFHKNTKKTPNKEINKAIKNYKEVIRNPKLYE